MECPQAFCGASSITVLRTIAHHSIWELNIKGANILAKGKVELNQTTREHSARLVTLTTARTTLTAAITKLFRRKFKAYDRLTARRKRKPRIHDFHSGTSVRDEARHYAPTLIARHARTTSRIDHPVRAVWTARSWLEAADGRCPKTREHILLGRQVGIRRWFCLHGTRSIGGRLRAAGGGSRWKSRLLSKYYYPATTFLLFPVPRLHANERATPRDWRTSIRRR